MDANTPGRAPIRVPVFIAQGTGDRTIPPRITRRFRAQLCRQGTSVRYSEYPGVTHTFIGQSSASEAVAWIAARFAGRPAVGNCRRAALAVR
jgi:acetyl esterase/lipase